MKTRAMTDILRLVAVLVVLHSTVLVAQLMSKERQAEVNAEVVRIRTALDGYGDANVKIQFLQQALAQATNSLVRHKILDMGEAVGGDGYEKLLISVVQEDQDVSMRISAVTQLGKIGTSRSIEALLKCAQSDPKGRYLRGDIVIPMDARREAYLALTEIGLRSPSEKERIAKGIRQSPAATDSDVKTEVLYILTGEERLLRPFYDRLASANPQTRISGVVAFRFLKLKQSPRELTQLLRDPEPEVRSWVALVLGEIGDSKTIPLLMDVAANKKEDRGTRCNAIGSLGDMRAKGATQALQQLLLDEDVKVNAAIALSKITGNRHPLVPDGYNLD